MKEVKKLTHYVLPEHKNHIYDKEAISSMALVRDIADKINDIVDTFNNMLDLNLEKLQVQDGEIRKGILYIKDNLYNTLSDLMDSLQASGYVDKRIQENIKDLLNEVAVLEARLDTIYSQVQVGSTTLDTEVIDGRIGTNGNKYPSLGTAIREGLNLSNSYISKNLVQGSVIAGNITIDFVNKLITSTNAVVSVYNGFYNVINAEITIPEQDAVRYLYFNKTNQNLHYEDRWYIGVDDVLVCTTYNNKIFFATPNEYLTVITGSLAGTQKVTFYGDSNTATNYFQPLLKDKVNIDVTSLGLSSSCIANFETWAKSMSNDERIAEIPKDSNIIFIWGGINDWASRISIGTLNDTSKDTYIGGYKYLIEKLLTEIPNANIVLVTPGFGFYNAGVGTEDRNGVGVSVEAFVQATFEVANYYKLNVISPYYDLGINKFNKDTYLLPEDVQVHYNSEQGAKRLASLFIAKLKELGV